MKSWSRKKRAKHRKLKKKRRPSGKKFPVATIAYYGPDDKTPVKIAVGIIKREGEELAVLKRWLGSNVVNDPKVKREILSFIQKHAVKSVVMTEGVIGCPHEEGIDYPVGQDCPFCPFWKGKQ